ncbi:MAG: hypothetical protein R2692_03645 [Microbacterium sp.]
MAGVGDERPHALLVALAGSERGVDVVEQGVQRRADLGDLVEAASGGAALRHSLGDADVADIEGLCGDQVAVAATARSGQATRG